MQRLAMTSGLATVLATAFPASGQEGRKADPEPVPIVEAAESLAGTELWWGLYWHGVNIGYRRAKVERTNSGGLKITNEEVFEKGPLKAEDRQVLETNSGLELLNGRLTSKSLSMILEMTITREKDGRVRFVAESQSREKPGDKFPEPERREEVVESSGPALIPNLVYLLVPRLKWAPGVRHRIPILKGPWGDSPVTASHAGTRVVEIRGRKVETVRIRLSERRDPEGTVLDVAEGRLIEERHEDAAVRILAGTRGEARADLPDTNASPDAKAVLEVSRGFLRGFCLGPITFLAEASDLSALRNMLAESAPGVARLSDEKFLNYLCPKMTPGREPTQADKEFFEGFSEALVAEFSGERALVRSMGFEKPIRLEKRDGRWKVVRWDELSRR